MIANGLTKSLVRKQVQEICETIETSRIKSQ